MADSCCICGVILASDDSEFPEWCKVIRALCLFEGVPTLSGMGYVDADVMPFNLSIGPSRSKRFCYRRTIDQSEDFCYPFHATCWTLLEDHNDSKLLDSDIETLFNIFESFHYNRNSRSLRWGHNYYFEDVLDSDADEEARQNFPEDIVTSKKEDPVILTDPSYFNYQEEMIQKPTQTHLRPLSSRTPQSIISMKDTEPVKNLSQFGLLSLPEEIFESIVCNLDICDALYLLIAYRGLYIRYWGDILQLPSKFWRSRFWTYGETAFARSLRPSSCSLENWFFTIKSGLKGEMMNLRNRKRIWKLVGELITIVRTIKDPKRVLYSDVLPRQVLPRQIQGPVVSCLALKYDIEGCREVKQIYVPFGSCIRSVTPSHVCVASQNLISGLTFTLEDGRSVDAGYVVGGKRDHADSTLSPKYLWLVSSSLGFQEITIDTCPQQFHNSSTSRHGDDIAVAKWPLESLKGIWLGLDAMRIVRIRADVAGRNSLDDMLWESALPLSTPSVHESDILALQELQRESFTPASTVYVEPEKGELIAISVYSCLGWYAGITGIRFVYNTGRETIWGSTDAASLTFFLLGTEELVKVTAYKSYSLVCHLQFTTSLNTTSLPFPPLPQRSVEPIECVDYKALNSGHVVGFAGCFAGFPKTLYSFGVMATTMVTRSMSPWSPAHKDTAAISCCESRPGDMPLGWIGNHGEHHSCLLLEKKYRTVQACINLSTSTYRRAGQVIGLLFRSSDEKVRPTLLGQWTEVGWTYDLEEGEQILDILVTTSKPRCKRMSMARPKSAQVDGLILVTSLAKISWSPRTAPGYDRELIGLDQVAHPIKKVLWDFNAIFDRVQCIYD